MFIYIYIHLYAYACKYIYIFFGRLLWIHICLPNGSPTPTHIRNGWMVFLVLGANFILFPHLQYHSSMNLTPCAQRPHEAIKLLR